MADDRDPTRHSHTCDVDLEELRRSFRRRGLRITRQRERIYEALASARSHPTAEELHQTALAGESSLSLATVYNTLEAFAKLGLCHRIANASGPTRYDADVSDHVHLVADDGRIFDLPEDLSDRLLDAVPGELLSEIEQRMGVRIGNLSMRLLAEVPSRDA